MKLSIVICVVLGCLATEALNPANFKYCDNESPCTDLRGLIHFDAEHLGMLERYTFRGRSWSINPSHEQLSTSITIVFKDFYLSEGIFIIMTSPEGTRWQQISDRSGSFEFMAQNVTSVSLYVLPNERGHFQAYYYVGCTILNPGSDEIIFPTEKHAVGLTSTCWIVKSIEFLDRKRVYISMRDVHLTEGSTIIVEDLHNNAILAVINETMSYEVYEADTEEGETILVDLICDEDFGTCRTFGNLFSLSYYSINDREVTCIETQKQCALGSDQLPAEVCRRTCPVLERIIGKEIEREGKYVPQQTPILKSAGAIQAQTAEQEEGDEEEAEDKRIPNKRWGKKNKICRVSKIHCRCLKSKDVIKTYCFSNRRCNTFKPCHNSCFWTRFIICAKMRSRASISLLG